MKDINIVYLNYLLKDDILKSLPTLIDDVSRCPYDVQITVADNSQNRDGIREEIEKRFPQVKYIDCGGNVGFGQGNIKGFEATPARYYFALNCDTVIPENSRTVERFVRFLDEHKNIACIGPKIVNMDGSLQYSCYRFDLPSILIKPLKQINLDKKYRWVRKHSDKLEMKDFDHNETRPVDWVLGAAMIVRADVAEKIGWFDDRYFMYMEDCDWCRTMWENSMPVYYVHDIVIYHTHNRDSAKVPGLLRAFFKNRLARIHFMSWVKYLWKWRGQHKYYAVIS